VKLSLELDPGSEPIVGRIQHADGTVTEFTGWLELTQVLEAARSVDRSDDRAQSKRSLTGP
jgi:hypothetical protein